jgi:hypothetical protein
MPDLHDKPVAVCHSDNPKGTAEISSANYPARNYGAAILFSVTIQTYNLVLRTYLNIGCMVNSRNKSWHVC